MPVFLRTKDSNRAIGRSERLDSLERLLAVVEAGSSSVHIQMVIAGDLELAPLAILVSDTNEAIDISLLKRKFAPVNG